MNKGTITGNTLKYISYVAAGVKNKLRINTEAITESTIKSASEVISNKEAINLRGAIGFTGKSFAFLVFNNFDSSLRVGVCIVSLSFIKLTCKRYKY